LGHGLEATVREKRAALRATVRERHGPGERRMVEQAGKKSALGEMKIAKETGVNGR